MDRNGNTTTFGYDGSNELTAVTDMNGQSTTINYERSSAGFGFDHHRTLQPEPLACLYF